MARPPCEPRRIKRHRAASPTNGDSFNNRVMRRIDDGDTQAARHPGDPFLARIEIERAYAQV
jgi:hypothetical protein